MHNKIITSLLIVSTIVSAVELNSEKFQLVAQNIDSKNNIVTALGSVVIFSPTYYLSADKIIYDKEKDSFELFDNVLIIKNNNIQTQSNYAFIDLKNDISNQTPLFLMESTNNIWINSKTSKKEANNIDLDKSIISSCDCDEPVWSIKVSSATYDVDKKWVNAYNPRLYIKKVPVMYSPYIGFSTDNSRRSGLLIPTVGYSKNDGVYYSQPIYFAPAPNYDVEVIPQIRTQRGYGGYGYLRYADSDYSLLKVKAGGFRENRDYQLEAGLKNQKHFGWNIDYNRTKLFSKGENVQDGLYSSLNWMNDIEYKTLENEEDSVSVDKNVESKINYFYNTPEYYAGMYARYYIDTSKNTNDATLQELPQAHFHSYTKETPVKKLLYSVDTKIMNYTREDGIKAKIYELSLPLTYTKYFLDDFMYFTVENKTTINKYDYSHSSTYFEDGNLIQNETSVSVGSDLLKPYDNYLHTMNLNAKYTVPKNVVRDGDLYKITNNDEELSSFPIVEKNKNINLSLNQSLYGKDSLKQIVNHKVSQSILYNDLDEPKLQNFKNFVKVNHDYGYVSGKTIYNVQDKQFIENTADASFNYKKATVGLGYFKSKETENSDRENLESYRVTASYKIAKDYKVAYYENYNLIDKIRNKQGINFNINDRCWNLDLRYEKEIVPSSSSNPDGINQNIVYLSLELKPLGGVKQKYKFEND